MKIRTLGTGLGLLAAAALFSGCATRTHLTLPTKSVSFAKVADAVPAQVGGDSFITKWEVLGPFSYDTATVGGEQNQEAAQIKFLWDEKKLSERWRAPAGTTWKSVQGDQSTGIIDLDAVYGNDPDHVVAYAVANVWVPRRITNARLYVGSDDYIKVWVNHKLVHTYAEKRRAAEPDQDMVEGITLKAGYNRVVVKCVDVVLGWQYYLRLTDGEGRPYQVSK